MGRRSAKHRQKHQRRHKKPDSPDKKSKSSDGRPKPFPRRGPHPSRTAPEDRFQYPGPPGAHASPRKGLTTIKATVDKTSKGTAFLIFGDSRYEDAFIPRHIADSLFHRDRVAVSFAKTGEIMQIDVIDHRYREVVGQFSPHQMQKKGGWVLYQRKSAREEIFIPEPTHDVKMHDWIRVELEFHEDGPHTVTGVIVENYGESIPSSADIPMIAGEYGLIEEHSTEAIAEARSHTLDPEKEIAAGRTDLRKLPLMTIDGEDARDFDDAVYVEKQKDGYWLWVAIADVSHYVTEKSKLNQEAYQRGTSVYFPERAFHMLPRELSEHLCSLKPNEPRLALVAKMFFDSKGHRQKIEIFNAVIESHRRATYNQIEQERKDGKDPQINLSFELFEILKKFRINRGTIDFDLPEAKIKLDEKGDPKSISIQERLKSHQLIEEFMIAANESVTDWAVEQSLPFLYRIHEDPNPDNIQSFISLAKTVGLNLKLKNESITSKEIAELLKKVVGHPSELLLNTTLLRSMRQAVYSEVHGGHFGLASKGYTHFTSPIRRYPDLVVHRLLKAYILENQKKTVRPYDDEKLQEITEHCSYRERLATEAERETIKIKQVRMMKKHLGQEFKGRIIGMTKRGLFVQIREPYCEGMVTGDSLNDDFYRFDEKNMTFSGRRKSKIYRIGDEVTIIVNRADIELRQIDFGLKS